ncbi:MAG: GFA family protein [Rhodospirillales bacterium]
MAKQRTGGCLCGKVRYRVEDTPDVLHICHCSMCQRWSGGPSFSLHVTTPVTYESDETLVWFDSSDWAQRGFCNACGSSIAYRLKDGDDTMISAGTLDDLSGVTVENQIFIDEKPGHYDFAGDIPALTGAEVFALLAPADEDPS